MKDMVKNISRMLAIVAAVALLLSPLMLGEALAQACKVSADCSQQSGAVTCLTDGCLGSVGICVGCSGVIQQACQGICSWNGTYCQMAAQCLGNNVDINGNSCGPPVICKTPEMSDYLAMAFLVVAGGMVYYIRRRALAVV